jgi:hypothetical protein
MANIKLSDLIKQINEEFAPPGGWRASDKIKKNKERKLSSAQASKREGGPTSVQAGKLHANNSARFVESAQAQEGRKPNKTR